MLPRWHILWGFVFTVVISIFFNVGWFYLSLIFLSSFLIDFDHYTTGVTKTGKLSLPSSYEYYKKIEIAHQKERRKGIRQRGDFQVFHTVEFHLFVLLLGFLWAGFIYIFIGMFFHSALDFIYLVDRDILYRREYFLTNWIKTRQRLIN